MFRPALANGLDRPPARSLKLDAEAAVIGLLSRLGPGDEVLTEGECRECVRSLMERSVIGMALFSGEGILEMSNPAWRSIWSPLLPDRPEGAWNLLEEADRPGFPEPLQSLFMAKGICFAEFSCPTPGGNGEYGENTLLTRGYAVGVDSRTRGVLLVQKPEGHAPDRDEPMVDLPSPLLSGLPGPAILWNRDARVQWANQAAEDLSRTGVRGLEDAALDDVFFSVADMVIPMAVKRCMERETAAGGEWERLNSLGEVVNTHVICLPVRARDGDSRLVLTLFSDKQRPDFPLEGRGLALSLREAVAELAAGVAHEINNPLNALLSCSEWLLESRGKDPAEDERILREIVREVERIARVVNTLTAFSGHPEQAAGPVDPVALLDGVLVLARAELVETGVRLELEVAPCLPRVVGRPQELRQVFHVLVHNVIRSLCPNSGRCTGTRTLRISMHPEYLDGRNLVRCVFTGTRRPEAEVAGKSGQSSPSPVPAIGLSLCRKILAEHGARLEIERKNGEYVRVSFELNGPEDM
ncbi:MAG: histidine kinase dimerization/phospho-acceptor domain-containing protein [Desulfatibacillaceae bacterium]